MAFALSLTLDPTSGKHDGNLSHGKFSYSFLFARFQNPPFLRSPAGQAKHSELFAGKTLTNEPPNQLLLPAASCIFFRKQGNKNDKLKSAGGGGGGGGTTLAHVILIAILRR